MTDKNALDGVITLSINQYDNTCAGRFNFRLPISRTMSMMKVKLSLALRINFDNNV